MAAEWENIKKKITEKMNGLKFGKTRGRQRMSPSDITEDREQWRESVAASVAIKQL